MTGKLKALALLLIVFGSFYVGWKVIPVYVTKYQLQDELDELARRASYTAKTEDEIRQSVINKASSMDVPLREDQVAVTRMQDGVGITIHYHVRVDLVVRPVDFDFTVNSFNKRI